MRVGYLGASSIRDECGTRPPALPLQTMSFKKEKPLQPNLACLPAGLLLRRILNCHTAGMLLYVDNSFVDKCVVLILEKAVTVLVRFGTAN